MTVCGVSLLLLACANAPPTASPPVVAVESTGPASPPAALPTTSADTTPDAAPTPSGPPSPVADTPLPEAGLFGATRRSLRFTTEWLARGVDSWFGDTAHEQGKHVTHGRLGLHALKRESDNIDYTLRLNARFRLPNLKSRTYAFVGRDNDREVVTDTPGAVSRQERLVEESPEERSFFAGLGVLLFDSFDARIGFRGGLKPYAQTRYRKPWHVGEDTTVEFRETIFWTLDDHLGSTTALTVVHSLTPRLTLRWNNAATVSQEQRRLQWSSVGGIDRAFGTQRTLSFELIATGRQGDPVTVAEYGAQVKWEQPAFEAGLLGELVIGHFWPHVAITAPRRSVWAVGAGLRLLF